jgi:hypothetical protein
MTTEIRASTGLSSISFTGSSASKSQNANSAGLGVAGDSSYYIFTASGAGTNTASFRFRFSVTSFTIPITATIDGFQFKVIKKRGNTGSGSVVETTIQLYDGTSNIGTNKALGSAYPTTDTLFTYGGSTDLWGASLTPALINNAGFRVAFVATITSSSGDVAIDIDYAEATVFYTYTLPASQTRSVGGAAYSGGGGFSF